MNITNYTLWYIRFDDFIFRANWTRVLFIIYGILYLIYDFMNKKKLFNITAYYYPAFGCRRRSIFMNNMSEKKTYFQSYTYVRYRNSVIWRNIICKLARIFSFKYFIMSLFFINFYVIELISYEKLPSSTLKDIQLCPWIMWICKSCISILFFSTEFYFLK